MNVTSTSSLPVPNGWFVRMPPSDSSPTSRVCIDPPLEGTKPNTWSSQVHPPLLFFVILAPSSWICSTHDGVTFRDTCSCFFCFCGSDSWFFFKQWIPRKQQIVVESNLFWIFKLNLKTKILVLFVNIKGTYTSTLTTAWNISFLTNFFFKPQDFSTQDVQIWTKVNSQTTSIFHGKRIRRFLASLHLQLGWFQLTPFDLSSHLVRVSSFFFRFPPRDHDATNSRPLRWLCKSNPGIEPKTYEPNKFFYWLPPKLEFWINPMISNYILCFVRFGELRWVFPTFPNFPNIAMRKSYIPWLHCAKADFHSIWRSQHTFWILKITLPSPIQHQNLSDHKRFVVEVAFEQSRQKKHLVSSRKLIPPRNHCTYPRSWPIRQFRALSQTLLYIIILFLTLILWPE